MEKEIEITVRKILKYDQNDKEQQVIFTIPPANGENIKDCFEAVAKEGNFNEGEWPYNAKAFFSITEWAGYPKKSNNKKIIAKYAPTAPLMNEYVIQGKVIDSNEEKALIDAGKGLIISIQNGISRKKILKKGNFILVKGRLNIERE